MEKKVCVWIHCRISMQSSKIVLSYQKEELIRFAIQNNLKIIGITKLISDGKSLNQFGVKSMLSSIRRHEMDIVLLYSPSRLSIYPDVFEEFVLFCKMHNVKIFCLSDINY